jgi:transcriptional regulator with GAF, ATPase, and Fis domain
MASSTTKIESPASLRDAQRDLEKRMVYDALKYTNWNISRAARRLGIARQQLQRIMKKYDLTPSAGG